MTEPILEAARVTKRYAGHLAVDALSLRVRRGIIYGLLGPNGAGKTTTIRMINDIVKPDEGTITLFGELAPGRAAQRRIGYLPEERGLYPKMTVRRVLTYLGELRGLAREDLARRVARWLDRLGLAAWADQKVEALSKGMQQKVQFAATALHDPDLLILDEPFSGLDPINADLLRAIVREARDGGKTILFSTHLMEHAEQMCDEICIVARARKVLDGELRAIKRDALEARRAVIVELEGQPAFERPLAPGEEPRDVLRALVADGAQVVRFERAAPTLHEIFVARVQAAPGATEGAS